MSKYTFDIAEVATIHRILDDLWNRKITPENFAQWREDNGSRILEGRIAAAVVLQGAEPVKVVTPTE